MKIKLICPHLPFTTRAEEEFDLLEEANSIPVDWSPENGFGTTVLTKNMYPRVAAGNRSLAGQLAY